jgi:hypothetical protein
VLVVRRCAVNAQCMGQHFIFCMPPVIRALKV